MPSPLHRLEYASPSPALRAAGGKGPLAQEEARWLRLRTEKEGEAIEELKRQRSVLEAEASRSQREGQLCATPFGVDVVGITEFVALTGALVGGGLPQAMEHTRDVPTSSHVGMCWEEVAMWGCAGSKCSYSSFVHASCMQGAAWTGLVVLRGVACCVPVAEDRSMPLGAPALAGTGLRI